MIRLLFVGLFIFLISCNEQVVLDEYDIYYGELKVDKKVPSLLVINKTDSLTGKIKHRGGGSVRFAKKSYTFKLDAPKNLLGDSLYKKWIFNASYIDKTLIRHKFNYELYKSFTKGNIIAESKYITLNYNDEYQGIYLLLEKIGSHKLGLDWNKGAYIFKEPSIFNKKSITPQEPGNYYQQNYPELDEVDYNDELGKLRSFIMNASDEAFKDKIGGIFDLDNIIDWHMLILFANNGDGVLKNFYLYKRDSNDLLKVIPWDYDHSLGRDGDNELNMMRQECEWERNTLLDRLVKLNPNSYNERLTKKWAELREKKIIDQTNLFAKMKEYETIIKPYLDRNFEKWPVNNKEHYYDSNNFEQEIGIIKEYIPKRIAFLDQYFAYYE